MFVPKKTDMSTVDVPYLYYTCEITMYISIHIETIFGNVDISEFPDILVCDKHTIEKHNKTRRCPISEFVAHIGFILLYCLFFPKKMRTFPYESLLTHDH